MIPSPRRATLYLRLFGWKYVKMIFWLRPTVIEISENHLVVKIPLNRRTRNHVHSLYLGAMTVGAELAGAGLVEYLKLDINKKIIVLFKDVASVYFKRAEGDTHFTCLDGYKIKEAIIQTSRTGERITIPVKVIATVPDKLGDESVAEMTLGLSIKKKD